MKDKQLKNRALLSFCSVLLEEAEESKKANLGTSIVNNDEDLETLTEAGNKMLTYCIDKNFTKESIVKMNFNNYNMFKRLAKYYNITKDIYHDNFNDRHIPILFALATFEYLRIDLDINYNEVVKIARKSDILKRDVKVSKLTKKEIVVDTEVNQYEKCLYQILEKLKRR